MGVLAHEDRRRVQDPEADRTLVDGKQRLRDDDDHAVEKSAGTLEHRDFSILRSLCPGRAT